MMCHTQLGEWQRRCGAWLAAMALTGGLLAVLCAPVFAGVPESYRRLWSDRGVVQRIDQGIE